MRLPSKREVDKAKAADQKRAIDEGMKLATRIDVLRETLLNEEARLVQFRTQSVAAIHAEIDRAGKERESLLEEVRDLKIQREKLLRPLDEKQRELEEREELLSEKEESVRNDRVTLSQGLTSNENISRQFEAEKGRIADLKRTISENLVQSENTLKQAQEDAQEMRKKAKAILSLAEVRDSDSLKREREAAVQAKNLSLREAVLLKGETKLAEGQIRLRDREQTLLRTEQRLKQ